MKRFVAITLLAAVMALTVPQAFAGDIASPGFDGPQESPGVTSGGGIEMPGLTSFLVYLTGVLISD